MNEFIHLPFLFPGRPCKQAQALRSTFSKQTQKISRSIRNTILLTTNKKYNKKNIAEEFESNSYTP